MIHQPAEIAIRIPGSHSSTKLEAGGFNLTVNSSDTGELVAHKVFVLDAIDEELMEGANEAYVACHTKVGVNITWTKKVYLEFTIIEDSEGNWTIPCFAAGGENVTQVNSSNEYELVGQTSFLCVFR